MCYCAASSCLISISQSRHHSISQSPDSHSQTTMEWFLRSPSTKYFPDFSVTRGRGEDGEVQCEDLRATSSSLVIVHGTWSFYARVKITVQIIMCENYFQKLCSRGVYTICFTPNWGNLNHPAPGPGHISSEWQLVIMNVIFSSRVVTRPRRCMQHTTFYAAQGMKKDLFALYGQKMMVNYNSFIHPKLR